MVEKNGFVGFTKEQIEMAFPVNNWRSENMLKYWVGRTTEEKQDLLDRSFHSKGARESGNEARAEGLKRGDYEGLEFKGISKRDR